MQRFIVIVAALAVVALSVSIAEAGRFGRRGGCGSGGCYSNAVYSDNKAVQGPEQGPGPKASPSDAGTPPPPPPPGGATPPPPPPGGGAAIDAASGNVTATAAVPTYSSGASRRFRVFRR